MKVREILKQITYNAGVLNHQQWATWGFVAKGWEKKRSPLYQRCQATAATGDTRRGLQLWHFQSPPLYQKKKPAPSSSEKWSDKHNSCSVIIVPVSSRETWREFKSHFGILMPCFSLDALIGCCGGCFSRLMEGLFFLYKNLVHTWKHTNTQGHTLCSGHILMAFSSSRRNWWAMWTAILVLH